MFKFCSLLGLASSRFCLMGTGSYTGQRSVWVVALSQIVLFHLATDFLSSLPVLADSSIK